MSESERVLRCATVISDLDRSGDPVCSSVPKAKAYNYYNGETARGCIRSSCDLSTGCGSKPSFADRYVPRDPIVDDYCPRFEKGTFGPSSCIHMTRKAQSLSKLRSVADRNAGEISNVTVK